MMDQTHKASSYAQQDFISNMPDNVVTNILDRLPIQVAVRTSILSSDWRFKWTMLSKLVFDLKFYSYLLETNNENSFVRIIGRLLLHLKGAISLFELYIDERCNSVLDAQDINHWLLFLSKKGLKDLIIWKMHGLPLMLPTHFFSCLELKYLRVVYFCFDPPTSFHCFPSLLSLDLALVKCEKEMLGEFFARCLALENLNIGYPISTSNMKLSEIAKLANLKKLSLHLCNLDVMLIITSSIIFELVGSFPKLQKLHLDFHLCEFTDDGAKKSSIGTFPHLKALELSNIDLNNYISLSCVFELIMSFPNLQTLEISMTDPDGEPTHANFTPKIDYNASRLLQLRSVVFTYSTTSENEVCLIKYLLACSPLLKRIVIRPCLFTSFDDEYKFVRKLSSIEPPPLWISIYNNFSCVNLSFSSRSSV